jgi:hypothetical protein
MFLPVSVVEKVLYLTSLAELGSACCVHHCANGKPVEISKLLLLPDLLLSRSLSTKAAADCTVLLVLYCIMFSHLGSTSHSRKAPRVDINHIMVAQ